MGEITMNDSVWIHLVPHVMAAVPPRAIAAPAYPPMSAWEELEGMPYRQVMTFQMIAPSSAAKITFGLTKLCSIIPPPIALATPSEPLNAAAKLKTAAQITARTGLSTRVPTIVAMEFAESWKPLLKSNTN